mmetsp:Transcript_4562/g.9549  ORF Transcript_4562/g.9549 Transcript_4562/m.9549 type:complete len:167 (-) Transcript_4562:616-1116(-)
MRSRVSLTWTISPSTITCPRQTSFRTSPFFPTNLAASGDDSTVHSPKCFRCRLPLHTNEFPKTTSTFAPVVALQIHTGNFFSHSRISIPYLPSLCRALSLHCHPDHLLFLIHPLIFPIQHTISLPSPSSSSSSSSSSPSSSSSSRWLAVFLGERRSRMRKRRLTIP